MEFITDLWLPILVSAIAVFFISSLTHMVLGYHKSDYSQFPNEDAVLDGMRGLPPGDYVFPWIDSMKEMNSEEMIAKVNRGPVGFTTIRPSGPWNLGKQLGQWFLYTIIAGVFIAYLASLAVPAGADFSQVMRITSVAAFLAYCGCEASQSIWKSHKWSTTFKFVFDGLLYGLATGAIFGWLWPS